MLALAEPHLQPGASCTADTEPQINVRAEVECDLGNGFGALITGFLSPDAMRGVRSTLIEVERRATGNVRSLRWRFVVGLPGAKTGIPADRPDQGEGVRVRFVSADGLPVLYFDQDSSAVSVMMTGGDAVDLDRLREFWRRPAG